MSNYKVGDCVTLTNELYNFGKFVNHNGDACGHPWHPGANGIVLECITYHYDFGDEIEYIVAFNKQVGGIRYCKGVKESWLDKVDLQPSNEELLTHWSPLVRQIGRERLALIAKEA